MRERILRFLFNFYAFFSGKVISGRKIAESVGMPGCNLTENSVG
jgi:hypothetical protein